MSKKKEVERCNVCGELRKRKLLHMIRIENLRKIQFLCKKCYFKLLKEMEINLEEEEEERREKITTSA